MVVQLYRCQELKMPYIKATCDHAGKNTVRKPMLPEYSPDTCELPAYESRVELAASVMCKLEFDNPLKANFIRRWSKAQIILNNTVLEIQLRGYRTNTKRLSMQYAQVGFACDYTKGKNPIRLRANGMQILFEFNTILEALQWIHALNLSIGVSLPIEEREMPPEKYQVERSNRSGRRQNSSRRQPVCCNSGKESDCDHNSVCSMNSTTSNTSLLVPEDVPSDSFFSMKDFGVLYRDATWEGSRWCINNSWSLVQDNCIYNY